MVKTCRKINITIATANVFCLVDANKRLACKVYLERKWRIMKTHMRRCISIVSVT